MKLFTTKQCPNCPAAKQYLDSKGVEYELLDAHEHIDEIQKLGISSVPTLVFGEKILIGLEAIQQVL